jgi:hypothetical protein
LGDHRVQCLLGHGVAFAFMEMAQAKKYVAALKDLIDKACDDAAGDFNPERDCDDGPEYDKYEYEDRLSALR